MVIGQSIVADHTGGADVHTRYVQCALPTTRERRERQELGEREVHQIIHVS